VSAAVTQHFTHNRRGQGGRSGAGAFGTRLEGANLAHKVWLCRACYAWHWAERDGWDAPRKKPPACRECGERQFLHFDSRGEAQRFVHLMRDQRHGLVRKLRHHPRFPLHVPDPSGTPRKFAVYEADSYYQRLDEASGEWLDVVEDFKPADPKAQDPQFKLKRRAFELQHGIAITIVS